MSEHETDDTDFPVCPHCGCRDQDWWDGLEPKSDGDVWECDCHNCSKTYLVTMCVTTTFSSRVKESE
jgi:hypothetical protein